MVRLEREAREPRVFLGRRSVAVGKLAAICSLTSGTLFLETIMAFGNNCSVHEVCCSPIAAVCSGARLTLILLAVNFSFFEIRREIVDRKNKFVIVS
jgi:hypothetical protein